eukprot:19135-Eustigmatos_ZCMA.PRE.1
MAAPGQNFLKTVFKFEGTPTVKLTAAYARMADAVVRLLLSADLFAGMHEVVTVIADLPVDLWIED